MKPVGPHCGMDELFLIRNRISVPLLAVFILRHSHLTLAIADGVVGFVENAHLSFHSVHADEAKATGAAGCFLFDLKSYYIPSSHRI